MDSSIFDGVGKALAIVAAIVIAIAMGVGALLMWLIQKAN